MQGCPGSPLGKGAPESPRRLGVPTCIAISGTSICPGAHGSLERHTARPGQAHLLPSAQALGKKKTTKTKQTNKRLRKLRERVRSKAWALAWHLGPAEGTSEDGRRFMEPWGGLSHGKPGSGCFKGHEHYEHRKEQAHARASPLTVREGPPYWGQSLGFPGVCSALPRATAPACLRSRCDPRLKVTKTLLGAECVVCVGFMCGAPPDSQGEAGRRLYCTR